MLNVSAARNPIELRTPTLQDRDPLPFVAVMETVRRRRLMIIAASTAGLGLGLLYLLFASSQYTAVAALVTDTKRAHSVPAASETSVDPAVIESQIEMVRSEKISLGVIRKLNLDKDPEFVGPGLLSRLFSGLGAQDQPPLAGYRQRQALAHFDRSLSVSQIGRSYIANIRFTSTDPEKAARIANAVAEGYIDDQLEAFTSSTTRASSWIQSRLDELRRQADVAAETLVAFKSTNNIAAALSSNSEVQLKLHALEMTAASSRRSYETFQNLNRYSQTSQEQFLPVTEARLLSEAVPPAEKSAPKTGLTLLLSLMLGCGLGLATAFGREYSDRTVRDQHQLEAELGIKCLGYLPRGTHRTVRSGGRQVATLFRQHGPSRQATQTLIAIRRAIEAHDQVSGARVIGITSASENEGKTTLALNLADSIAEGGKRVLLIDADPRNRSLTSLLAADCTPGPADAPAANCSLDDLLPCPNFRFHLLPEPHDHQGPHPTETLCSADMRKILARAKKAYDYVVLDLPAVLKGDDVVKVAGLIDAFVLVAEYQRTSIDSLGQVLSASHTLCNRLVGGVINKKNGIAAVRRHIN